MCEYCEGEKPVHENSVCFMAGSIRFIHIVKQKFGHYLSISTWEFKIKHYKKWYKRWLELAEKFKEDV